MLRHTKDILRIAPILVLFTACTKHTAVPSTSLLTTLQYITQDSSLSLLNLALQRTGMVSDSTFTGGGPYTFFAPQDSAFINAGLDQAAIRTMDTTRLRSILQYELVKGRISSQDLTGFFTEPVITLDTAYQPTLTKNYYGLFLDGVPALKTDELGDGVIQETGRMVLPPTGNMLQEIDSLPELSFFAVALRQSGVLLNTLQNPEPKFQIYPSITYTYGITILAPTNAAFQAFGFPDTLSIINADPTYLARYLLENFVFEGTWYSSNFKGGFLFGQPSLGTGLPPVFTQNYPEAMFLLEADGITFQSSANQEHTVHIIKPDIVGTNGVLHELDYMLIPSNQ